MNAGGDPVSLIQMLSSNYEGFAQMANLLQQWLQFACKASLLPPPFFLIKAPPPHPNVSLYPSTRPDPTSVVPSPLTAPLTCLPVSNRTNILSGRGASTGRALGH